MNLVGTRQGGWRGANIALWVLCAISVQAMEVTSNSPLNSSNETDSTPLALSINISNTDRPEKALLAPIMHYDFAAANNNGLAKRTVRAPNSCPRHGIFVGSQCSRDSNAQTYTIWCLFMGPTPQAPVPRPGFCNSDEICIESEIEPPSEVVAYLQDFYARRVEYIPTYVNRIALCVAMNIFRRIEGEEGKQETEYFHAMPKRQRTSVEAVVTTENNSTTVAAEQMDISAQTTTAQVYGTQIWRTLVNGTRECANCSSVELSPLPLGAKRIKVDVVLPAAITMGIIWLATFPYSGL